ncbi:MAG: cob(I)yrinic acid a,c-diamide adenosyltransferase [Bryobacteraceae bacterium]
MEDKAFNEPRLALNRIYTRRGDAGETSLVGGQRVAKDSLRIESYGTIDELNAFVGAACLSAEEVIPRDPRFSLLSVILRRIQHELFNLGSILATRAEDVHQKQARITEEEVRQLETEIDTMNDVLAPLRSFLLPGGSRLNVDLHICRTVCRRAERVLVALARQEEMPPETVRYINRLSDALFVFSRWANHILPAPEVLWEPNESASGRHAGES